jgi:lipopolysaccharide transport system ATP-binding protein
MNDIVIKAENLGKKYIIGHQAERGGYTALRDVLMQNARTLWNKTKDLASGKPIIQGDTLEEVWALKDVSFEIKRGEAVGIIGRNGAGKSTLLKILSRITEPSTGLVTIKGRVASLLEVGTGFHPELSGRENIYLNGTILGMTRVEIKRKFDEIVAFAEVEKYLDTPVKRYSSGMYVRLAFAVAAHLEPEILVVDEVLAVGDAQFQKKCLGKMSEVGKEGRTVLFVSHNMDAIERLCGRVVWLRSGQVVANSDAVNGLLKEYLFGSGNVDQRITWEKEDLTSSNPYFDLLSVKLVDAMGKIAPSVFANDMNVSIMIEANIDEADKSLNVGYAVYSENGKVIYWSCFTDTPEDEWPVVSVGKNRFISRIPQRLLNEGNYTIEVMASLHSRQWLIEPGKSNNAISFRISGGLSDSPFWYSTRPGVIAPVLKWENTHEAVQS